MPLTFTVTVRCFGSVLVMVSTPCAVPVTVGENSIVTAIEPCGLTVNSPPLTTKGAPCVGTPATSVAVPAFSILIWRDTEWLPTATLPNLIEVGCSFNLPPGAAVGVGEADGVAVAVGVGVLDAVAVAVVVALALGDGVAVAVAVVVAVGVGVATIPS